MSDLNKITLGSFNTNYQPTWCPGCGDFGIWTALKMALVDLQIPTHQLAIVYGIGCGGNMASTIKCYAFHSLHGRTLPVALGIKLANKNLTVIAVAGDGDQYSEGTNHLIHLARYNANLTLIVCNNQLFSLTTGQTSPTSDEGIISKTTPKGEVKQPLDPLALSLISGATFVARGAAFEIQALKELIKKAILHQGFSHLDVLQQCVTFNKVNTIEWYKQKIYSLEQAGHKTDDFKMAVEKSREHTKLPLGIFYEVKQPTYEEEISNAPMAFDFKKALMEFI
ncbi:MAG TPA: thiamine pyrophosphate-dependent enzyme [bacterium]|nr:thiamine pyrophosphate-dependent enzyme [bacterium]